MATVLYASELGENLDHLTSLSGIAERLREGGPTAVFAVLNVGIGATILGPGAVVLQAPVWPIHRHFGARDAAPVSYADILAAIGFSDPAKLAAMIGAWSRLIDLVKPDVVVANHSPGLTVALHDGGIPIVAVGSGFTMPPLDYDQFPPLRGDGVTAIPESRLLQSLRAAQMTAGRTPSLELMAPFRTTARVVFGVPELDPYRSFRRERVAAPPGGLPAVQPTPAATRLFADIGDEAPNFEPLAQALSIVRRPVEAYLRGETGPVPEFLRSRGVIVHDTPPALNEVLPRVSHVLTLGSAITSAAAFAAGRAQLVLPPQAEAELNLTQLEQFGVAQRLAEDDDPAAIASGIDAFIDDAQRGQRAMEIAQRLDMRVLPDGGGLAAAAVLKALS